MKEQLLESKDVLINHLEQKLDELKRHRNQLLNGQSNPNINQNLSQHINIGQYLKQKDSKPQESNTKKPNLAPKIQNFIISDQPQVKSRADVIRQQKETKEKLIKLEDLYNKKKQLESIGIYQVNGNKINSLYRSEDTRKKIDKKVVQNKKKVEQKNHKDKIIKEQLQKVQLFLKQSKDSQKKRKQKPEHHYSKLIGDNPTKLKNYQALLMKKTLKLVQKQKLLQETFQILKQFNNCITKPNLKIFLVSNLQFCDKFYITKNEIMRDLDVYQTANQGILTYNQFYQFVKSIQITNKDLKPSLAYKQKQKAQTGKGKIVHLQKQSEFEHQKSMQNYLKKLFLYLDSRNEKIIERQRLEIALKKGLLYDEQKFKIIKKNQIMQFGQILQKRKQKMKKLDYYQNLDLKYIGFGEIIDQYKKYRANQKVQIQNQSDILAQNFSEMNELKPQAQQFNFQDKNQINIKTKIQQLPKQQLEINDFQNYGWGKQQNNKQKFKSLKQIDQYYKEMKNKYGNQIHWNGFEHYKEDFDKFNSCIKQMNVDHSEKPKNINLNLNIKR